MIVVSILIILAGVGLPSYREWIENSRVRNAASSILNGIQKARTSAVLNNTQVRFTLGANSAWTVQCVTASSCPGGVALIEQRNTSDGSSSAVTVTPVPAAATTVTFSNLGIATAGGLTRVTLDTTALSSGNRPLRVEIGASGAARMCDPAFSLPDPKGC